LKKLFLATFFCFHSLFASSLLIKKDIQILPEISQYNYKMIIWRLPTSDPYCSGHAYLSDKDATPMTIKAGTTIKVDFVYDDKRYYDMENSGKFFTISMVSAAILKDNITLGYLTIRCEYPRPGFFKGFAKSKTVAQMMKMPEINEYFTLNN
jgi:hypothetical protein